MPTDSQKAQLKIKKVHPDAIVPRYAHEGDAGLDLFSIEDVLIGPRQRMLVGTGIQIQLPDGCAGLVQPRSGLAIKHGITLLNTPGLIDTHYRGEVKVIMYNASDEAYQVKSHDRIAQLVVQEFVRVDVIEGELEETVRGDGGFGSTGT